jgi:hypothetical protein
VALLLGASFARAVLAGEGQAGASLTADQLMARMAEAFKGVKALEAAGLPLSYVHDLLLPGSKGVGEAPYQVTAIPRTLIIDREGKVADDFTGLQEERTLRAALAKLGIR